jgi:hypothetical protein
MGEKPMARIFIAGPMESVGGNWNVPLFDYVAEKLRTAGYEVFNPAEHLREAHGSIDSVREMDTGLRKMALRETMRDAIMWIIDTATSMLMLPGWERSPGAVAERAVALAIGLPVHEAPTILLPTSAAPPVPSELSFLS